MHHDYIGILVFLRTYIYMLRTEQQHILLYHKQQHIMSQLFAEGEVIIGEYSPGRSRGEYSPIITEPEANNCFSIFVFFWTEFILISLISLSV